MWAHAMRACGRVCLRARTAKGPTHPRTQRTHATKATHQNSLGGGRENTNKSKSLRPEARATRAEEIRKEGEGAVEVVALRC